jgi:Icc-related predicted phosphoesterase
MVIEMTDAHLLVCSDLHGSDKALDVLKNALEDDAFDAVVVCGDFTTNGSPKYVKNLLSQVVGVPVLGVPGNCDTTAIADLLAQAGASVHGRRMDVKGLRLFGFGGAPPSPYGMPFEVDEETMAEGIRAVGVRGGIMVTHTPALGMNDLSKAGHHMGSKALLDVTRELRPRLALSGHIHEARGETVSQGTVFVNPGPAKEGCYAKVRIQQSIRVSMCRI